MVVHSVARELPSRPGTPSRLRAPALLGSSLSTGNLTLTRIQTAPAEIPNMHELKSIMGSLPRGSSLQLHPFDASYGATTRHHHANGAFYYRTGYDDLRCSLLRSGCPFWRIGLTARAPLSQAIMSRLFRIDAARNQARSTPDALGGRTALPAHGPGPFGARTDAAGAGGVPGLADATATEKRGGRRASARSLRWAHHSCGTRVRTGPLTHPSGRGS